MDINITGIEGYNAILLHKRPSVQKTVLHEHPLQGPPLCAETSSTRVISLGRRPLWMGLLCTDGLLYKRPTLSVKRALYINLSLRAYFNMLTAGAIAPAVNRIAPAVTNICPQP